MTAPTVFSGSRTSPTFRAFVFATTFSRSSSWTFSCTISREHAEHFCPWKPNAAATTPLAASSRSAVSSTRMKSLPPISSTARLIQSWPGATLPGLLADLDADLARAGEGDHARLRMLDERVADRRAAARDEVQDAGRNARLLRRLDEHRGDGRRVGRGLQTQPCCRSRARPSSSPSGSRAGSSTGGMTAQTPSGMNSSSFFSPGYGRQGLGLRQPLHLARVELAEVDRLGRVAVRLGPGLGLLEHHHRGELVLAFAQDRSDAQDELPALLGRASGSRPERPLPRPRRRARRPPSSPPGSGR